MCCRGLRLRRGGHLISEWVFVDGWSEIGEKEEEGEESALWVCISHRRAGQYTSISTEKSVISMQIDIRCSRVQFRPRCSYLGNSSTKHYTNIDGCHGTLFSVR